MPLIPCLKHDGSYILYIKIDKDKTELICDECCLPFYDKKLHANQSGLIHIKSVLKSPYLLLSNDQNSFVYDTLNQFDKINDKFINSFLDKLNTQITNIQNAFQVVQKELEDYANQFLNMKQKFKNELEKVIFITQQIIQFDQFKQIIVNLENLGNSIKSEDLEINEKILYKYLQDIKNIDYNQLYFLLLKKIEELRIQFNDLNKQQYPECQKLQEQLKSFHSNQIEFINQIKQITFDQVFSSKILSVQFLNKIITIISSKLNKQFINYQRIYLSTIDGLNGQSFWNKVNQKQNLLMIFKSKSGYIFGAFSPCNWISNCNGAYVQDNTLSSFIFSQTHDQIYPIKKGCQGNAIYCNQSYGPTFGGGHDINISTDFQGGYSNLGNSYQCDQFQLSNTSTHLFGQSTPNIAECEILMLTFL
ncbi:unnamed protein product [Paramecium pentaurelia]|uniref:TLDc domain-containing protein n=1 Tax=Paramecium pentaurelia TaxID=43138 RepID=A0A8S1YEF6_9CILI|nr:unnamed protein product [Paramecium pentaurelia]